MNQHFIEIDPLNIYDFRNGLNQENNTDVTQNGFNENFQLESSVNEEKTVETETHRIEDISSNNVQTDCSSDKNLSSNDIKSDDRNLTCAQNNGNIVNDGTRPFEKGKRRVKKERSNYWSEKITEKDFPFYGCAVCNICYVDLSELDRHIATHKDRITSYDLRVKNQLKRKKLKKEKKKLKKLGKEIKKENEFLDIEIKPEDGYIGNETTSQFQNKDTDKSVVDNDSRNKEGKEPKAEDNKDLVNLEKIFKCFACQKQFTLSYYLKLHVRSHTDEKPYTCDTCGQSFITASKLGRHKKRFHLQIKYQCRICYRYFSKFDCLTTHFDRKHPDDKIEGEPYDYNAILPYLKELEEELRQKSEQAKTKTKELWTDGWTHPSVGQTESDSTDQTSQNALDQNGSGSKDRTSDLAKGHLYSDDALLDNVECQLERPIQVILEEVKPIGDFPLEEVRIEVKTEANDQFEDEDFGGEADFKMESGSDSEYFPEATWASASAEEPSPPPADPLTCRVCLKRISSASYMKVHMRTHTGEKPFKCYVCDLGFITSSKMHRHVLTHTVASDDGTLEFKKEDAEADNQEMENDGEGELKNSSGKEKGAKTKKKSKKNGTEKEKKKKNYQKRTHICEFCHQRFLHLEMLQVHRKSHEGEPRVYKCRFCLLDMQDDAALKAHEDTHTGPKPYLCTICGKGYKKKETMVYHRKHHKADSAFLCSQCSKSFSSRCKLQRHALTHGRQRSAVRYECPVCAHLFHTKYHVGMHLATHQREGLIVEQNRNEILAMVLQNARKVPPAAAPPPADHGAAPPDERSRVCNICGEVFQHFYYLEEHLKNHGTKIALEDDDKEEVKKHVCKVCNKGFKLHYYLKLHSFTHTKEKPHTCQQCGKGFITRGKLKRHLETHAGLKKFQCHVCYKYFTRPSYLRIHVRTIHGTQDYNFRLARNMEGFRYSSSQAVV